MDVQVGETGRTRHMTGNLDEGQVGCSMTSTGTVNEPMELSMTETIEAAQVIAEALAVIDRGLSEMLHRELVSTDEVADLLLDVRTILAGTA
jgi:hypothetical protein